MRAAWLLAFSCACRLEGAFECGRDEECRRGEVLGVCESSGYCSFADSACDSGQRYADNAASELAATCVDPVVITTPPTCLDKWHDGSVRFSAAVDLGVNTAMEEGDPFMSNDETTLLFSSNRTGSSGFDIWTAMRTAKDQPFAAPVRVPMWSSPMGDGKFSATDDGLLVSVTQFEKTGGEGGQDVWLASRASLTAAFGALGTAHVTLVNTPNNEYDAVLSSDGLRLYVAAVNGPQKIVVAARADRTVPFGAPVLVPEIAVDGANDADPSPSRDETILIFTSTRPATLGGANLWYAVRESASEPWGVPQLVPDVNTEGRDGDANLSADGCTLYFTRAPAAPSATGDLVFATVL